MAQVRRNDIEQTDSLSGYAASGYDAGGPVAQLQADLALRLAASEGIGWASAVAPSPVERWVRLASATGGYAALLAGYAAVALVVARWI